MIEQCHFKCTIRGQIKIQALFYRIRINIKMLHSTIIYA